jgi:hypothetical protein
MIKLSIYHGYRIHNLRKFENKRLKVWWYPRNLNAINNPLYTSLLYQAEIDGQIIIKYDEEKKLIESNSKNSTIFI